VLPIAVVNRELMATLERDEDSLVGEIDESCITGESSEPQAMPAV
jgi:hypothetical protein